MPKTPMRSGPKKRTGYSKSETLPVSPAKAWSDKMMVGSYGPDGRGARVRSSADGIKSGYREQVVVRPSHQGDD
jgi:hypothetical protein